MFNIYKVKVIAYNAGIEARELLIKENQDLDENFLAIDCELGQLREICGNNLLFDFI